MTPTRVVKSPTDELEPTSSGTAAPARAKVAIVEDHSMVAEGFARIVAAEKDFEFVGTATTLADAMVLVENESPEVLLMDYHLPDGEGDQATRDVLARFPNTKILMMSGSDSDDLLGRAIEAGCSGFLTKTRPAIDIVTSIRAVLRGELAVRANDLAGVIERIREGALGDGLTGRELEVLRHLARGEPSEEIAAKLFVSVHTIRNHVQNILMKLNAHSKLAAVATATRLGILGLDDIG
ncbi:MAG TPA: response regulator transcription factor [Acidimicrobiales bacterium]